MYPPREHWEHGACLSQRTLRRWQITHDRSTLRLAAGDRDWLETSGGLEDIVLSKSWLLYSLVKSMHTSVLFGAVRGVAGSQAIEGFGVGRYLRSEPKIGWY